MKDEKNDWNESDRLFDKSQYSIVSEFVKYMQYYQNYAKRYKFDNINMTILNNIYHEREKNINHIYKKY